MSGTVRYNNKILVSNGKFNLGKNEKVNSLETAAMKSHKYSKINSLQGLTKPTISHGVTQHRVHKKQEPHTVTHNEEKIAFVLFMAGGFAIWNIFQ